VLKGTIGQPDAGPGSLGMSGGTLTVYGGFWQAFEPPCIADFDGNGRLNVFDFLLFQTAFSNQDPQADLAPPFGVFNVFDFLAFQSAFGNGC